MQRYLKDSCASSILSILGSESQKLLISDDLCAKAKHNMSRTKSEGLIFVFLSIPTIPSHVDFI